MSASLVCTWVSGLDISNSAGSLAYLYKKEYLAYSFMEWRKPYELKRLILLHNFIQVVSCIYAIKEVDIYKLYSSSSIG